MTAGPPDAPNAGVARRALLATTVALPSVAAGAASARASHALLSATFRIDSGKVALALYRRRAASAPASAPVIVLSHGSTFAAQSTFDLQVASGARFSLMDILAAQGFDVWALDYDGYGNSEWSGGNSDIAAGVADLRAVVRFIRTRTGTAKLHFYGKSSGALRVGAYACAEPESVDHLILESFTWTGKDAPSLAARRKNVADYRASPRRARTADTIAAVFTRDQRDSVNAEVVAAIVAREKPFGDSVPSGTYLDTSVNLPLVDPAKLHCPVMVLRGEFDGNAADADLLEFFQHLSHAKRFFVGIAGAAHVILLGRQRQTLHRAIAAFLPPARV